MTASEIEDAIGNTTQEPAGPCPSGLRRRRVAILHGPPVRTRPHRRAPAQLGGQDQRGRLTKDFTSPFPATVDQPPRLVQQGQGCV